MQPYDRQDRPCHQYSKRLDPWQSWSRGIEVSPLRFAPGFAPDMVETKKLHIFGEVVPLREEGVGGAKGGPITFCYRGLTFEKKCGLGCDHEMLQVEMFITSELQVVDNGCIIKGRWAMRLAHVL